MSADERSEKRQQLHQTRRRPCKHGVLRGGRARGRPSRLKVQPPVARVLLPPVLTPRQVRPRAVKPCIRRILPPVRVGPLRWCGCQIAGPPVLTPRRPLRSATASSPPAGVGADLPVGPQGWSRCYLSAMWLLASMRCSGPPYCPLWCNTLPPPAGLEPCYRFLTPAPLRQAHNQSAGRAQPAGAFATGNVQRVGARWLQARHTATGSAKR